MTQLRDERLRQAMAEAPDAGLRPAERTREAILAAAAQALQPWWKRWWAAAGDRRMPWAAAFATIVLATLVTVLWQGQEIPGVDRAPPVQAPAAPAAAPAPAPAPPRVTAEDDARASAGRAPAQRAQRAQRGEAVPRTREAPAAQQTRPPSAPEERRLDTPAAATGMQAAPAGALPPPPPAAAPPATAPPATAPPATAPPATAPPATAPPPAPAAAPAAPTGPLRAAALPEWSRAAIASGGRSVIVERADAGNLPALIARLPFSAADPVQGAAPASLRIELTQGALAVGVLEGAEGGWRWTPAGDTARPRLLRASAELSAALQQEAERLLAR